MRRSAVFGRRAILVVAIVVGLVAGPPAQALNVTGGSMTPTCTDVAINMTYSVNRDNTGAGAEHYGYLVTDGYGTVLVSYTYTDNYSGTDTYTLTYGAAPQANPITARFVSFAGNGLGEETYYTSTYECSGLPSVGFQGPGIPAGFVLRTMACTTAVFDAPNGQAVGSNRVLAGQNWYVNPTPSAQDVNGRRWTEVFVSGYQNGYIPAECVGGQETLRPSAAFVAGNHPAAPAIVGATGGAPAGTVALAAGDGASGTVSVNGAGQTVYTVALGDRLYRIALRFGLSLTSLAAANGITNWNLIYPGQQLIIPG